MKQRWSDEDKARAAKLWAEGHSASQIAAMMGVERNAVIGIAHRNRAMFPGRQRIEKHARRAAPVVPEGRIIRRVIRRPIRQPDQQPVRGAPPEMDDVPFEEVFDADFRPAHPVTILAVTDRQCRWPLWPMADHPGKDGLVCGDPVSEGSVWCGHHRMKARAA